MSLSFAASAGAGMRLDKLSLQFAMRDTGLAGEVLEAYERLILDAMRAATTPCSARPRASSSCGGSRPSCWSHRRRCALYDRTRQLGPKSVHQLIAPHALAPARAGLAQPESVRRLIWPVATGGTTTRFTAAASSATPTTRVAPPARRSGGWPR